MGHTISGRTMEHLAVLGIVEQGLASLQKSVAKMPDGGDKVEHIAGFFVLMAAAVQVFDGRRAWWRAAALLVLLGIAIEIAQGTLTTTRSADPMDALADAFGVLLGLCTATWSWLRDLLWRLASGGGR